MEFKIITTYPKKRTYAYQLKAILQFDSDELATKAYRSIIGSTMAGQLMPCKTYHVDNYLVLCAYEETFDQLIEFLKNLDPADADNTARTHFWDSFFHSDNWADIVDAAYDYFHDCFPEQTDWEDDNYLFQFTYRKTTFFAEMPDSSVDGTKVKFYADEDGTEFLFAIGLTDDPRKIIDDFIGKQKPAGESKVTPESAMFAAMKDIDFAKALPKDTERKLKGIANLFFQSWLKDASVFGVEASDDIAAFNWVEASLYHQQVPGEHRLRLRHRRHPPGKNRLRGRCRALPRIPRTSHPGLSPGGRRRARPGNPQEVPRGTPRQGRTPHRLPPVRSHRNQEKNLILLSPWLTPVHSAAKNALSCGQSLSIGPPGFCRGAPFRNPGKSPGTSRELPRYPPELPGGCSRLSPGGYHQ